MSYNSYSTSIHREDADIARLISLELSRQQNQIELIASENIVSKAVLEAQGSVLTNKYAEGYPSKRYYGGCCYVDSIEELAIQRACNIFGCTYANVQPHSGSQANQAVFFALLNPYDVILGMSLEAGGHLTHGSKVSIAGKWFKSVSYGVNRETGLIDFDHIEKIAKECRPKLIIAGATAYPRIIDFKRFRQIADSVGAYLLVDMAHISGLVAASVHPSPFPYAHVVTSTTHKTLRGPRGGIILSQDMDLGQKINKAVFPGLQGGSLMHVIAAKAVCFYEAMSPEFVQYAEQILKNAYVLAETLKERGVSIMTNGTENHLMLVDLRSKGLSGKEAETLLEKSGLTCNKNAIPFDPLPVTQTSGIRLGSACGTSRGFKDEQFRQIAHWISDILESHNAKNVEDVIQKVNKEVVKMCHEFPIYT